MEKKKVVFLLGAGCEGEGQYGLPSGSKFKRELIRCKNVKKIAESINRCDRFVFDTGSILKWNSYSTLYQTIEDNDDEFEKYFTEEENVAISKYRDHKKKKDTGDVDESKKRSSAFGQIYRDKIYTPLTNDAQNDGQDDVLNWYLDHASICSFLDSYFNYLRTPDRYERECSRVMKMYFSAFQSIVDSLKEATDGKISKKEDCTSVEDFRRNYSSWLDEMQEYVVSHKTEETYYKKIHSFAGHNNATTEVVIITTNYTKIIDKVMKPFPEDNIVHLHGLIDEFEEINSKRIANLSDFAGSDYIFPSILVQSGVKPIISPVEIERFYRASSAIQQADYIMILGYGLNSDDEHIVNLLRNQKFKNPKHKIIDFIYSSDKKNTEYRKEKEKEKEKEKVKKLLKVNDKSENIIIKITEEFDETLDRLPL